MTGLIEELEAAGSAALGISLDPGTVPRLLAYSRSVASFPTAVKEVNAPTTLADVTDTPLH